MSVYQKEILIQKINEQMKFMTADELGFYLAKMKGSKNGE